MEDKLHWSSNISPRYLTWRALLALLTVHCSAAERLYVEKNLHPSDLMLPITNNKPRGLSVNIEPPRVSGLRTSRLWSESRSVWLTTRSQTVTHSPPLIMPLLKLSSSSRNFSVLHAARGLSLNISLLYSFSVSHTQTAKDRNREEMVGEEKAKRLERSCSHSHTSASITALRVFVSDTSLTLTHSVPRQQMCRQSSSEHLCNAAVSLCPFNPTSNGC